MDSTQADLTVVVRRTIKDGQEHDFEESMKKFVNFALSFEGHRGINIIRPSQGNREYVVVDRFLDRDSRDRFTSSPEYREWMDCLGEYTEGTAHIQEMSGLDAWFNDPGKPLLTPPQYKTAIATWIGVCIVIFFLNAVLAPYIENWAYIPNALVFNACVVTLLTWVVMPLITKLLRNWLFNKNDD